jgi:phage terminase large subunit-like protein
MCAANAALEIDAAENRKFTKKKSTGRIDGLVALAMAVGSARVGRDAPTNPYESRGIRTL